MPKFVTKVKESDVPLVVSLVEDCYTRGVAIAINGISVAYFSESTGELVTYLLPDSEHARLVAAGVKCSGYGIITA